MSALKFRTRGEFNVIRLLSSGGFGSVQLANYKTESTNYILKEFNLTNIRRSIASFNENMADRVVELNRLEHLKMQKFDNPYIVRVFGSFEEIFQGDDPANHACEMYYLVMEFCEGGDLAKYIDEATSLVPEPLFHKWTRQLVSAVQYLHERGYVHRAITSRNIFMTKDQRHLKLGDMGLARDIDGKPTHTMIVMETFPYMAPEVIGGKPYTKASDIWSLGVTLYEIAHFIRPFIGKGLNLMKVIQSTEPSPFADQRGYSKVCQEFVTSMLRTMPEQRPSANQLMACKYIEMDIEDPKHPVQRNVLWTSIKRGGVETVRRLVQEERVDVDVRAERSPHDTPLIAAVLYSQVEVVNLLLELGANVNLADEKGVTALYVAAQKDLVAVVRRLAGEFKAVVDAANRDGVTPLMIACQRGKAEVARVLAGEFNANVNLPAKNGATALHIATKLGDANIVTMLVAEFGAKVDIRMKDGAMPLHVAAEEGHVEVTEILAGQFKASVSTALPDGSTPLYIAAERGHYDLVELLAGKFKANVEAETKEWATPLFIAAQEGHADIVKLLAEKYKAKFDKTTMTGGTPLSVAALEGHAKVVRILVEHFNVNVNEVLKDGFTVLHFAAAGGQAAIVKLLVTEYKAKVNAETKDGITPLHIAAEGGHLEVVKLLAGQLKANVNATDKGGVTPLGLAAYFGKHVVVDALLNTYKAKVNWKKPVTPLSLARNCDESVSSDDRFRSIEILDKVFAAS